MTICIATTGNELFKSLGFTPPPDTGDGVFSNSFRPRLQEQKANQTGSGLFHSIVKELVLPGRQEELRTNANSTHALPQSQAPTYRLILRSRASIHRPPFACTAVYPSLMRHIAHPTSLPRRYSRTTLEFQPQGVRRKP